ncbi:hypothetical protein FA15DRAFT_665357, partial [Coprinopsis marcescibilis]
FCIQIKRLKSGHTFAAWPTRAALLATLPQFTASTEMNLEPEPFPNETQRPTGVYKVNLGSPSLRRHHSYRDRTTYIIN